MYEVIQNFPSHPKIEWILAGDRPDVPFRYPDTATVKTHSVHVRAARFGFWEQVILPFLARRYAAQLLHSCANTAPIVQAVPTVVTIHDIKPWMAERRGYDRWYRHSAVVKALEKSKAIITVSNNSRRDIEEKWPRLSRKIHVIPHGISDVYFSEENMSSEPLGFDPKAASYILYVGGPLKDKRFEWAVDVFSRCSDRFSNLELVACGFSAKAAAMQREKIAEPLRSRVRFLPYVPEELMPMVYRHAHVVLYPTLYEGFGFPALEAQAVGTPILMSRVGSLGELEGPGAKIVPVDSLDAWVDACNSVLSDRFNAEVRNEASMKWARSFSWKESAKAHLAVYEKVALNEKTP